MLKITQFLQFALIQCRKEFKNINTINFHSVVEKYVSEFLREVLVQVNESLSCFRMIHD